jgi:UDP-N-acetylglucosamine 2-epimerase (non-hydrolysing)
VVLTGQHPDLSLADFNFGTLDAVRLRCPGSENPHAHVRAVTRTLSPFLAGRPNLLVVQGDTSSALGGALAGFTAGVPVAHVEAGLRTHDPLQPWPEEEYRVAIDAHADLLFAPTARAAANLEQEQVPGAIFITGNTIIDAVLAAAARLPPPAPALRDSARRGILVTCHRRESWGEGLASIAAALRTLADECTHIDVLLHPNLHVAAQMRELLGGVQGVSLIGACAHDDLLQRMRAADLILSDSGGIQEEAPALGVPLLVLREKTERPEGIECGCASLVGTDPERIVGEVRSLLDDVARRAAMSRPSFPYGNGHAAPRIAAIVRDWLEGKQALSPVSARSARHLGNW